MHLFAFFGRMTRWRLRFASEFDLDALARAMRDGANAQYATPQYRRLLTLPLNQKRAQMYTLQKTHLDE